MSNVVEAFISKFCTLKGISIAEKKVDLFLLFQEYSSLSHNQPLLDAIASQLVPRTHLENIFFVDFLIYFRCVKKLFEEFLKGDEIVVSKIAKHKWFFEESFKEIGPNFVDQFLSTLSYSLRLKVLKKLVLILEEGQSDQIFDGLVSRYGVYIASNILTCCSSQKIKEILRNQPIKLWTSQLKLLYKKNPNLMYVYFEERVLHEGNADFMNCNSIVQFIAMKNPTMFCHLQEKYKFQYCPIGKRTTKKIVRSKKDLIIAKPELYAKNLHAARLVRNIGRDFQDVYLKLFPRRTEDAITHWNDASKLLRCYPKRRQFTLFKNTFEQVFADGLDTSSKFINNNLLEMISDNDEREKWAERDKSAQYLKYFTANRCLKIVVEKLDMFGQVSKRSENIAIITESCLINKDWKTLLTVCELLNGQLRHDTEVHAKFLNTINNAKYRCVFDNLTEDHWKLIKQILENVESPATGVIFKYLEFAFATGTESETDFVSIMKHTDWISHLDELKIVKSTSHEKILLNLIRLAPQILPETETVEKVDVQILIACKNFNTRCPGNKIMVLEYPRLITSIRNALNTEGLCENHHLATIVEWIICTKHKNEIVENLTTLYWVNFHRLARIKTIIWFLRFSPDMIMKNVEKFLEITVRGNFCNTYWYCVEGNIALVWKIVKCYSHVELDKKLIQDCKHKLADPDFEQKDILARPLSVMMPPLEFIELVETYKPSTPKVNRLDVDENQRFQLQRFLLKSLVNLTQVDSIIPVLLQFLTGDFVASCLSPLHSCLYKVPENRIMTVLDRVCNLGPVSVKKHGFYFICITQDERTVLNSLKSCHLSQSIAMTYQYFTKTPSEASWALLKNKLTKLDNNDHFTSLLLVNKPAPKKYKSRYFETAFEIFRSKRNKFTQVLMDKLKEETIGELSSQFFATVKDDFLTMKKSEFVFAHYLLHCQDNEKFTIMFKALQNFKEKQWRFRDCKGREKLNQFVSTFFTIYMENTITNVDVVNNFREGFVQIFSPVEAFEEFVILTLMQWKNYSVHDLAKSILILLNDLLNSYGNLVVYILAECLNKTVKQFCSDEASKFELCCTLLDISTNTEHLLLIICLLPSKRPCLKDSVNFYYKVRRLLNQVENKTVQMYLCQHFQYQPKL